MARKSELDHEIERRVRGYIREEMVERGVGVNEMGRRLGMKGGTLSRILREERGIGPGFILQAYKALKVKAGDFLEQDPAPRFMAVGSPDVPEAPPGRQTPSAASPAAAQPGKRMRAGAGHF